MTDTNMSDSKSESCDSELSSEGICSYDLLSIDVQKRIKALEEIQIEKNKIDCKLYEEIYKLEIKYQNKYENIFKQRKAIVSGINDRTKCGSKYSEIFYKNQSNLAFNKRISGEIKGIPEFWLKVFKKNEIISNLIQEYDEQILKYLTDVRVSRGCEPMKILFNFYFDSNEFFENQVLEKEFILTIDPGTDSIFKPINSSGTEILWKKGKDVTIDEKKEFVGKESVNEKILHNSLFNFFIDQQFVGNEDKNEELIDKQWVIAHEFGYAIQNAILYYTGDVLEESESDKNEDLFDFSDSK